VYADDLLFATLDPTTRKVRLPGGKEVLLTDTVGFIQKLPTKLVSSFRATLEELEDASLVVHVVDSSSPLSRQQVWSVQNIIEELMVEDTPQVLPPIPEVQNIIEELTVEDTPPQILVLNKCDQPPPELTAPWGKTKAEEEASEDEEEMVMEDEEEEEWGGEEVEGKDGAEAGAEEEEEERGGGKGEGGMLTLDSPEWTKIHQRVVPESVLKTSAVTGEGITELLATIEQALLALTALVECHLPYSAGDVLAEIHKVGTVLDEDFRADGTRVRAYVPPSLRNKQPPALTH
ncbi:P-loop containing nucleoside triphosphate hydrolase protein, partial [Baffinella frigidus]